jgi:hypothetical protein
LNDIAIDRLGIDNSTILANLDSCWPGVAMRHVLDTRLRIYAGNDREAAITAVEPGELALRTPPVRAGVQPLQKARYGADGRVAKP